MSFDRWKFFLDILSKKIYIYKYNVIYRPKYGKRSFQKTLRAKDGWNNDGNGTDNYGFAALPGGEGYSSGRFESIGTFGYWWTATENSAYRAYTTNMDLNRDRLRWDNDDKSNLANVRCVKD